MKTYLSGQISDLSQEEYTDNFERASFLVIAQGLEPVNPLHVTPCKDRLCGGGRKLPDGQQLHEYSCYMKYDILAMLTCESITMLPNHMNSSGARFELMVAIKCGLQVCYINKTYDKVYT